MKIGEIIKLEPRLLEVFEFATKNRLVESNLDTLYNKCMHRNNPCISDLVGYKSEYPRLMSSSIYEAVTEYLCSIIWEDE
jgi:hypothetical protein